MLEKNELAKAGVQFGTLRRFKFPLMQRYIFSYKNRKCILDLNKVIESCLNAKDYLKTCFQEKKSFLFIATKKKIREVVEIWAKKNGVPFVTNKWVCGLLTNFDEIKKNIKKFHNLSVFVQRDNFRQILKKEQKNTNKELKKLEKTYGGLVGLNHLPDVVFIVGLKKEEVARREAESLGIPVIAVCNTNCNPDGVSCIILGNDDNPKSIEFLLNYVTDSSEVTDESLSLFEQKEEKKEENKENE